MSPKSLLVVAGLLLIGALGSRAWWQWHTAPTALTITPTATIIPEAKKPTTVFWKLLAEIQKIPMEERDELCLALNGYFEARNEPAEGQRMVMYITDMRKKEKRAEWGKAVCEVVFKRSSVLRRGANGKARMVVVAQFAWTTDERILRHLLTHDLQPADKVAWRNSRKLAREYLAGEYTPTPHLRPARYYLNPEVSSRNGKKFFTRLVYIGTIGLHKFYRPKKST